MDKQTENVITIGLPAFSCGALINKVRCLWPVTISWFLFLCHHFPVKFRKGIRLLFKVSWENLFYRIETLTCDGNGFFAGSYPSLRC